MEASLKEAWSTLVAGAAAAPGTHDECRTAGSPGSSTTEPEAQLEAACHSEAAAVPEAVAAAAAAATTTTTEAAATTAAAAEPPGVIWDAAACAATCANCRVLASKHQQDAAALVQCMKSMVDAATANVLHVSVKNVPCVGTHLSHSTCLAAISDAACFHQQHVLVRTAAKLQPALLKGCGFTLARLGVITNA